MQVALLQGVLGSQAARDHFQQHVNEAGTVGVADIKLTFLAQKPLLDTVQQLACDAVSSTGDCSLAEVPCSCRI